jgi:3-demethoxyubiquinol 3-hydroxylase
MLFIHTLIDGLIQEFDDFIRVIHAKAPAVDCLQIYEISASKVHDMTPQDIKHSAALMRINHVGEICAQALYKGQQYGAKSSKLKLFLQHAQQEEIAHLSLCHARIEQLNSHTSYLNPLWYGGAFALGFMVGYINDASSLSFVVETEHQVSAHLQKHLNMLPQTDYISKNIVQKMLEDEMQHANQAQNMGAYHLPMPAKLLMKNTAKIMTSVAYYI